MNWKNETCNECEYAVGVVIATQLGSSGYECRLYPPQVVVIPHPQGVIVRGHYPAVNEKTGACFKFVRRTEDG